MAKATAGNYTPSISSDAVQARTGHGWQIWFSRLDQAGADKLEHKAIAKLLVQKFSAPRWWNQMIAVEYERARGLRSINQQASGYTLNASRTLEVSLSKLYKAIVDEKARAQWFPDGEITISSKTTNKCVRGSWNDGPTRLEINVCAKGPGKSQVTIQHSKFATARVMEPMRTKWKAALDRLEQML
jgi:hypothetical protein